jgi:exopolysaccharide biosynthesis polyprenyl glycosylphosphotransferase
MRSDQLVLPAGEGIEPTRDFLDPEGAAGDAIPRLVASSYGRRDYYLRRLLAAGDIAVVLLALTAAPALTGADNDRHILFGLLTLPVWLVIFKSYGLYDRDAKRISHGTIDDIPGLFHAVLVGGVLTWLYFRIAPGEKLTFITLLLFSLFVMAFALVARFLTRVTIARVLAPERVMFVGTGEATPMLTHGLVSDRRCHVQIVGRLLGAENEPVDGTLPVVGRLDIAELTRTLAAYRVGRVVLARDHLTRHEVADVLRECKPLAVKVSLLPGALAVMGPSVEVEDVHGVTMFGVNPPVLSRSSRWAKRGLDLFGASIALAVSFPVLAVLALLVRLDSPGPVFFRQERVGRNGRRFKLVKLRTMARDAERLRAGLLSQSKDPGWLHLDHDPRITRLGRLLRHTSLDELPQLWNVLRGHMSLVGPRPLVPEEDRLVQLWARGRLDLTPGITGLWQVLGRTSIPFEEMVKLDYLYVTNWSLWGDVRLMLRTLPVVLRRRGAN